MVSGMICGGCGGLPVSVCGAGLRGNTPENYIFVIRNSIYVILNSCQNATKIAQKALHLSYIIRLLTYISQYAILFIAYIMRKEVKI